MAKAPEAFRGISEVADILGVRQHTLRSWESRFPFVKPVKRPDGRRYYRPSDIIILKRLNRLLNEGKLSSKEILRLHRGGEFAREATKAQRAPVAISSAGDRNPLRDVLEQLTDARARLAQALGRW